MHILTPRLIFIVSHIIVKSVYPLQREIPADRNVFAELEHDIQQLIPTLSTSNGVNIGDNRLEAMTGPDAQLSERDRNEIVVQVEDAVRMAEIIQVLELESQELLIPTKKLVGGIADGTLTDPASMKLSIENVRKKILSISNSDSVMTLLRTKITGSLSTSKRMIQVVDSVLADESLRSETIAVFIGHIATAACFRDHRVMQNFQRARDALNDVETALQRIDRSESGLLADLRILKKTSSIITQSYVKAQRVLAIRRLKNSRWGYLAFSAGVLLLTSASFFIQSREVRGYSMFVSASIALMGCAASALSFRHYSTLVNNLEDIYVQ